MSVRSWLNNNSAVVTIVAVVVLVLALGFIVWSNTGSGYSPIESYYYYDMNNGRLVVASADRVPPFKKDGNTVVRAQIFACGHCPGGLNGATPEEIRKKGARLSRLERYPERARQVLLKIQQQREKAQDQQAKDAPPDAEMHMMEAQMQANDSLLVKKPGGGQWVRQMDPRAMQMMTNDQKCPKGQSLEPCYPGR